MPKAINLRDDLDKLYESRKEGGRGLASIKDSDDTSIRRLEVYIKKSKERLITVTRNSRNCTKINITKITRKQKGENYCLNISSNKK